MVRIKNLEASSVLKSSPDATTYGGILTSSRREVSYLISIRAYWSDTAHSCNCHNKNHIPQSSIQLQQPPVCMLSRADCVSKSMYISLIPSRLTNWRLPCTRNIYSMCLKTPFCIMVSDRVEELHTFCAQVLVAKVSRFY